MRKAWLLAWCLVCSPLALAQDVAWPSPPADSATALEAQIPTLARQVLADYSDPDPEREQTQRMRLQLVAGHYRDAIDTIQGLRERRASIAPAQATALFLQYELYADAKLRSESSLLPALRRGFARLDDRAAAQALPAFGANLPRAAGSGRRTRETARQ